MNGREGTLLLASFFVKSQVDNGTASAMYPKCTTKSASSGINYSDKGHCPG